MGLLTEVFVDDYGASINESFFKEVVEKVVVPQLENKIKKLSADRRLTVNQSSFLFYRLDILSEEFEYGYSQCYPKHFFSEIIRHLNELDQQIPNS